MGRIKVLNNEMSETDNKIHDWRLSSNTILLYTHYNTLAELKADFEDFNIMDVEDQHISDDKSIELFGKTNQERYNNMLHKMYSRPEEIYDEFKRTYSPTIKVSPLDKLFLMRECAINKDYLNTVNKNKFTSIIQEDASIYDIHHDKEDIKEEIMSSLESSNIWDNVGIDFPFLSLEVMSDDEGNLQPVDDDQKRWQNSYKKMMTSGDAREYMQLAKFWKRMVTDTYNKLQDAKKNNDSQSASKYTKTLIQYGWPPDINPNTATLNKASELTKSKIEGVLSKFIMIDLTEDNEDIPEYKHSSPIIPYLYIMCTISGSKYNSLIISYNNDFSNAVEIGFDYSSPHSSAVPMMQKISIFSITPQKCDVFMICNNNQTSFDIINKLYISNSPDFDHYSSEIDVNNIGGLKLFLINLFSSAGFIFDNDKQFLYKIFNGTVLDYLEDKGEKCINLLSALKMKYEKMGITESTTNEFPIEFDKDGNLLISKGHSIDFDGEYSRTHLALKMYEESNNITGMKYCICKLWYLNIILEDRIHDNRLDGATKAAYYKSRAKIMNDIKKYTPIILKKDPNFDILKTYQNSPFNNDKVVIKSSTLFYIYNFIKKNFSFKELKNIFK